jgi:glucuronokinase
MQFYDVDLPKAAQPSFVLSIENEELGIAGGLQDRVIQIYEGLVFMDFDKAREREIEGFRCYEYEPLDPALLPPVYIAYSTHLAEPTEVFHNDIRGRFNRGEEKVVNAMRRCGELAALAREAILARDADRLAALMNENFEMRRGIYNLPPWQVDMVETARRCGASAQFAGSGGTIIGTYRDDAMLDELRRTFAAMECRVLIPKVV